MFLDITTTRWKQQKCAQCYRKLGNNYTCAGVPRVWSTFIYMHVVINVGSVLNIPYLVMVLEKT